MVANQESRPPVLFTELRFVGLWEMSSFLIYRYEEEYLVIASCHEDELKAINELPKDDDEKMEQIYCLCEYRGDDLLDALRYCQKCDWIAEQEAREVATNKKRRV